MTTELPDWLTERDDDPEILLGDLSGPALERFLDTYYDDETATDGLAIRYKFDCGTRLTGPDEEPRLIADGDPTVMTPDDLRFHTALGNALGDTLDTIAVPDPHVRQELRVPDDEPLKEILRRHERLSDRHGPHVTAGDVTNALAGRLRLDAKAFATGLKSLNDTIAGRSTGLTTFNEALGDVIKNAFEQTDAARIPHASLTYQDLDAGIANLVDPVLVVDRDRSLAQITVTGANLSYLDANPIGAYLAGKGTTDRDPVGRRFLYHVAGRVTRVTYDADGTGLDDRDISFYLDEPHIAKLHAISDAETDPHDDPEP